eukprot:jgi/Tetstr1/460438/TSEL_005697.t1
MRQPQLLQNQVVVAALVAVVDARAPSEVPQDHVWTRPTPSAVERRTMRLPAGLSFRAPAPVGHLGTTDSRRRRERRHDTMDTSGAKRS